MSDRNRQKSSSTSSAVFATAAAVGIGALAAIGGYMYGKYQGEEEAKVEQSRSAPRSSSASQHFAAALPNSDGSDFQKPYEHECIICMRPFDEVKGNNEALHTTPCGHVFCHTCIQDALREKSECPVCRGRVESHQTLRVYL